MTTEPGLEGLTVAQWIYGTLTGSAQLQTLAGGLSALQKRVVEDEYTGTATWWITFTILPPIDVKSADTLQIMSQVQFQVKVVGQTLSYTPLMNPYRAVHAALEGRTNQDTTLGRVLTSHRVSGVQYPERTNGIEYRHLGGLYETMTQ